MLVDDHLHDLPSVHEAVVQVNKTLTVLAQLDQVAWNQSQIQSVQAWDSFSVKTIGNYHILPNYYIVKSVNSINALFEFLIMFVFFDMGPENASSTNPYFLIL